MGDVLGGIGGAIGGLFGQGDRDKATAVMQQALQNYSNINPNVNVNTQISGDPRTAAAQQQLLQQTMARARAGGLNASDIANVNNILGTSQAAARQAQAGAMDQARQQGTAQGNSGILGALVAGQNAANQGANQGINAAGIANQAAIANNQMGAQQAGALRGQNIGVEEGNVGRGMQLAESNKQNEYEKAAGQAGASQGLANAYIGNAQNTAAMGQGFGSGLGAAGQALAGGISGAVPWSSYLNPYAKKQGGSP